MPRWTYALYTLIKSASDAEKMALSCVCGFCFNTALLLFVFLGFAAVFSPSSFFHSHFRRDIGVRSRRDIFLFIKLHFLLGSLLVSFAHSNVYLFLCFNRSARCVRFSLCIERYLSFVLFSLRFPKQRHGERGRVANSLMRKKSDKSETLTKVMDIVQQQIHWSNRKTGNCLMVT